MLTQTWIGCTSTRWLGHSTRSRSTGMRARYEFVPLHNGSIEARQSAASALRPSDWARCAFSVMRVCRTADLRPSAPTSTSQVAVVPSSNRSLMGSEARWVYVRSRFPQCVLHEEIRCPSSTCWKSARWNIIRLPVNKVRQATKPDVLYTMHTLCDERIEFQSLGKITFAIDKCRNWTRWIQKNFHCSSRSWTYQVLLGALFLLPSVGHLRD